MNRRQLIKSMSVLAGTAMLSPKILLANNRSNTLHLVGIGDCGCKMIQYLLTKGKENDYTVINSNFKSYDFSADKRVSFELPHDAYDGRNINMATIQTIKEMPQSISNIFTDNSKKYIVFGGLGGFTGSYLTKCVASNLQESNIDYHCIISLPFTHEGLIKRKNAEIIRPKFSNLPNITFVDFDTIRKEHGNFKLIDSFTLANDYTYKAFKNALL